jgi:hypothetical protein
MSFKIDYIVHVLMVIISYIRFVNYFYYVYVNINFCEQASYWYRFCAVSETVRH